MTANPPQDAGVTQARKMECEIDGLYFNRYFMKQRFGKKMILGRHHPVMQSALDRTMLPTGHPDRISRLIINVPPGYTKTEMGSIHYIARGLAANPRARFLHLSYSHELALLNSATARAIVKGRAYQDMWPMRTQNDADSKSIWWTEDNGGVRATSSKGQVTGFRAGHMEKGEFSGALLIDDPVKPDDAYSEVMRDGVNNRFSETIASRLAIEDVPIIVIMQRIHHKDLSGYLLGGGSGEQWHHLDLSVIIDNTDVYPKEFTHGIQIPHGLADGWLWPYKHNQEHAVALMSHRRKFAAQYRQRPIKRDEEQMVWQEADINAARDFMWNYPATRTVVSIDPATTDSKTSDEHGIMVASIHSPREWSVDADYTRKGSPKAWADAAIWAHDHHGAAAIVIETNQGGDMCEDTLRNAGFLGKIIRVHASKGKIARAEPIAALYAQGFVRHGPGLLKLEDEMLDLDPISGKSNGKSPNRVDALVWALTELSKHAKFMVS